MEAVTIQIPQLFLGDQDSELFRFLDGGDFARRRSCRSAGVGDVSDQPDHAVFFIRSIAVIIARAYFR